MVMKDRLPAGEAARRLGISNTTLWVRIKDGTLKTTSGPDRRKKYILVSEINKLLAGETP